MSIFSAEREYVCKITETTIIKQSFGCAETKVMKFYDEKSKYHTKSDFIYTSSNEDTSQSHSLCYCIYELYGLRYVEAMYSI